MEMKTESKNQASAPISVEDIEEAGGSASATISMQKKMPGMSTDDSKVERVVNDLVSKEYDGKAEFTKAVNILKRKHKLQVKNSEIRRVYDGMQADGRIPAHPQMALFLRTKGGKSASGILSVTVFTSPYPE